MIRNVRLNFSKEIINHRTLLQVLTYFLKRKRHFIKYQMAAVAKPLLTFSPFFFTENYFFEQKKKFLFRLLKKLANLRNFNYCKHVFSVSLCFILSYFQFHPFFLYLRLIFCSLFAILFFPSHEVERESNLMRRQECNFNIGFAAYEQSTQ